MLTVSRYIPSRFDGSNPHSILRDLPLAPQSIAVDPLAGKLYMAFDGNINQVWTTNLDGSGMEVVFEFEDGPNAIALDAAARKMYLALDASETIQRTDLDGANQQMLHNIPNAQLVALMVEPKHAQMYWIDQPVNRSKVVFRSSVNGGAIEEFITEPGPNQSFGNLFGLAFDPLADHVYLLDEDDSRIYRVSLEGEIIDFLQPTLQHPRGLALRPEANQMYWIDNNGIFRSDLNGENVTPIVNTDQDGIYPLSIAVIPEPATRLLTLASLLIAASAFCLCRPRLALRENCLTEFNRGTRRSVTPCRTRMAH